MLQVATSFNFFKAASFQLVYLHWGNFSMNLPCDLVHLVIILKWDILINIRNAKSLQSKFSRQQMWQNSAFGASKDILQMLSIHEDIIRCCTHKSWWIVCEVGGNREPCFSVNAEIVALKDSYVNASSPSVSHKCVCDMIHVYHEK